MQPCSTEMGAIAPIAAACLSSGGEVGLPELQGVGGQGGGQFVDAGAGQHDDFFDQMLSTVPSWGDYVAKSPWDFPSSSAGGGAQKLFGLRDSEEDAAGAVEGMQYGSHSQHPAVFDESALLASRLRQHQISGGGGKAMALQLSHHHHNHHQQQMFLQSLGRSGGGSEPSMPLSIAPPPDDGDAAFNSTSAVAEGMYNGFRGSQPQFHHPPDQSFSGGPPPAGTSANHAAAAAPPRQRVRARRGQATDPHSIAERLRRERIAERMKALQELVPNANKTDKASMLDEIIDYVKFLQLQVKVLSMSRLGGAAAVTPLVADISSSDGQGMRGNSSGSTMGTSGSDNITVTEHQVAKLMEEDMGSAMQYLQGKGLCLMPISLASAISTATCQPRSTSAPAQAGPSPPLNTMGLTQAALANAGNNPSSPSMSVLTMQSTGAANDGSSSFKDVASVSKP